MLPYKPMPAVLLKLLAAMPEAVPMILSFVPLPTVKLPFVLSMRVAALLAAPL